MLLHLFWTITSILISSESEFNNYGANDIDTICEHFRESVKPDTLKREWMTLKHTLVQDFTSPTEVMQTLASDETLTLRFQKFCSGPSLTCFDYRLRTWFFSIERIKTVPRNRLKTETLDMLIRISSKGPTIANYDFDHSASVLASK